jgi:NitT/TauT family transport system permease protein
MPVLLTGLKTSATVSVIGAVVGEFIVADAGLGFLVNTARTGFNTPLVYVAVFMLAVVAGTLYTLVSMIERRLLAWQKRGEGVVQSV